MGNTGRNHLGSLDNWSFSRGRGCAGTSCAETARWTFRCTRKDRPAGRNSRRNGWRLRLRRCWRSNLVDRGWCRGCFRGSSRQDARGIIDFALRSQARTRCGLRFCDAYRGFWRWSRYRAPRHRNRGRNCCPWFCGRKRSSERGLRGRCWSSGRYCGHGRRRFSGLALAQESASHAQSSLGLLDINGFGQDEVGSDAKRLRHPGLTFHYGYGK